MHQIDKKEELLALYAEYKALNQVVGSMLLVEDATPKQMDDLSYYNRKLTEARLKIRHEARTGRKS